MPCLIFDCDGVLADTEQHGHLPAFNATFERFGLDVRWSLDEYAEKVRIGGGKERLSSLLTADFVGRHGLPRDPQEQAAVVAEWHRYKTMVYTRMVGEGALPPRPGIARLVEEARQAGWTLAVASTSARPSVRAVLTHAVGEEVAASFSIFAGDDVAAKKPAPDIYLLALAELSADPDNTLVIEDSENGCRASVAAGLRTVVTVSGLTRNEEFRGASLVVESLGDPSIESNEVLADPFDVLDGRVVSLRHLERVLAGEHPETTRRAGSPAR